MDHKRVEMHIGGRGYGRFGQGQAYGGALELGLGVRLIRGLHLVGEIDMGAHGLPFGVQARAGLGLRHELRLTRWVRPSVSLGYSYLAEAGFEFECGCARPVWEGVSLRAGAEFAERHGVEAGLGLRFPMPFAPRLSAYLRGDGAYYFDARPGRVQLGGGAGVQVVF
ncbi:hypothetical protein G6O69_33695 [Pseudenhygromyxa sp. WMMC2535]|uniref:hypothetical protein n=1 Tax=Pseudenhygromyxa sp. WMMC2535 TaxID=2712867 RepID=UPI0015543419|nr:hypothetical protein [Pseudenhygromyxa sp. WMMC2535]NVB42823.1 hypothetical protein [Pseudenhygromyxa sp. WMMC2535]